MSASGASVSNPCRRLLVMAIRHDAPESLLGDEGPPRLGALLRSGALSGALEGAFGGRLSELSDFDAGWAEATYAQWLEPTAAPEAVDARVGQALDAAGPGTIAVVLIGGSGGSYYAIAAPEAGELRASEGESESASLADVAATAARLGGLPSRGGRSLVAETGPADEEAAVLERLRGLGYIE